MHFLVCRSDWKLFD